MPLLSQSNDLVQSRGGPLLKSNRAEDDTDYSQRLSPQNHLAGQRYFDPAIENMLVPAQVQRDFQGDLNYGLDKLDIPGANYGGDTMAKAIQNKYAGQTDDKVSGIRTENEMAAKGLRSDEDTKASQELTSVFQKNVQNASEQYAFQKARQKIYNQWVIAKQQAESAMYGQIFGGIASLVGGQLGSAQKNK